MTNRILIKMKSLFAFVATTFIIIVFSTATYAVEPTVYSAHLDFGGGFDDVDCIEIDSSDPDFTGPCTDDIDENYPVFIGHGRANIPLWETGLATQLDLGGIANFTDRQDSDNQFHNFFYFGGHLAYRDPSSFAVGAFGSVGSAEGGDDEDVQHWLIGGEVQKYFGDLTLYVQAGFFEGDDETEDDTITDATFVRGVVRYFFGENTMVSGEFSWVDGEENEAPGTVISGISDLTGYSWGARIEHAFNDGPIAAFVQYHGVDIEERDRTIGCCDDQLLAQTFLAGIKLTFGTKSLKHEDRYGATFSQPDVGRWTGWTVDLVD